LANNANAGWRPFGENVEVHVRAARADDLLIVQDIERAAGQLFRAVGMPEIADDPPPSVDALTAYQQAGRAWVAADPADVPVAYLIADPVDGQLHIEQLAVLPSHARRRIGGQLIEYLAHQALAAGIPALTLTTFAEVPWNAPYYRRCGFGVIDDEAFTPSLRSIQKAETAHGLNRWPRVGMRRDL
jgi:GNAT superfamily N-acetyltransferase